MRRVEGFGDELVGLSYSQFRGLRLRGYCAIEDRRLLVFSPDRVFLCSHIDSSFCSFLQLATSPQSRILYGSFVSDQKPCHFVTVNHTGSQCFARTYSIASDGSCKSSALSGKKEKCASWKRIQTGHPLLFYELAKIRTRELSTDHASTPAEASFEATLEEEHELETLRGEEVVYIKAIKNIACGQTELILSSRAHIVTVILKQHSILLVSPQKTERPICEIEHWGGYYFILFPQNRLGVYKRDLSGLLAEVNAISLEALLPEGVSVEDMKLPALDWSDRLINVLSRDLPTDILLLGKTASRSVVMKYDIYKRKLVASCVLEDGKVVTGIGYGPYDNGPVMVGLACGKVLALDYYTLVPLFQLDINGDETVRWITYDPCNTLIVGTERSIYTCCLTECENKERPGTDELVKLTVKQH